MKPSLLAMVFLVFCGLIGCSKSEMIEPGSLVTKWVLVKDSSGYIVGAGGWDTTSYIGVAGDYFDFRNDGKCYTKEGNVYDTLAYQLAGSNKVTIAKFGPNINGENSPSTIDPFTEHRATITSPDIITPGGTSFRVVNLKK
ncbi:hypothetical protein [Mucilaginibacter sp.]|uniref:hypothetical protein n=1 Tax=Mucilaginibacter sp. TaxID=1882438 RepID=UPI00260C9B94|nr:hypothetical protein [Mucilaginibacter sp.]MDB4922207.1 hypothetical protein [Mucilaginibacter sp.]